MSWKEKIKAELGNYVYDGASGIEPILETIEREMFKALDEKEDGGGIFTILKSRGIWKDYLGNDND